MKNLSLPQWLMDTEIWVSLGLITIISALTHLPLIRQLGLYHEAWYIIWAGRTQTLSTYVAMFSVDRPIVGYIYTRLFLLLGDNPFAWQIFSYLFRLVGAIGFFWLLRSIWPKLRLFTTTAAILFIAYPGFLQGPNAVVFCTSMITYALIIYSILFTVIAIRTTSQSIAIIATGFAILCEVGYLPIDEFMIGLEALRVILIWYLIPNTKKPLKAKSTAVLLRWIPYLLVFSSFLCWRLFIFKGARPTTNVSLLLSLYSSAPFAMMQQVVVETLKGFLNAVLLAWTVPFYQLVSKMHYSDLAVGLILSVLADALLWGYSYWLKKKEPANVEETRVLYNIFGISLITVFCAIIPVTIANRHISFDGLEDHYTLHIAIGVVPLILGSIFLCNKKRGRLWLPLGLLFLSVLTHFSNTVYFRNAWEVQQQLWWELAWRAPQLEDGTVIMVNLPSDVYYFSEDYEVWAPANIIYNKIPRTLRIYSEVLYSETAYRVVQEKTEHRYFRNIEFDRDYHYALIVSMPSLSSCVHVIDGNNPELSLNEPPIIYWVAPYSHIQQITTGVPPVQPPEIIFGQEPPHTWCYYYQKMSLARQQGDWDLVVALGEEAINAGFKPLDQSEWMPLIEGYAYRGDLEKAESIITKIYDITSLRYNLCISTLKQKENPSFNFPEAGMNFLTDKLCNSQ